MFGESNGVSSKGAFSPAGWKLEPLSRYMNDHAFAANRCRNIIAALENLLNQLGEGWCQTEFLLKIHTAKEIYENEMAWHLARIQNLVQRDGEE